MTKQELLIENAELRTALRIARRTIDDALEEDEEQDDADVGELEEEDDEEEGDEE